MCILDASCCSQRTHLSPHPPLFACSCCLAILLNSVWVWLLQGSVSEHLFLHTHTPRHTHGLGPRTPFVLGGYYLLLMLFRCPPYPPTLPCPGFPHFVVCVHELYAYMFFGSFFSVSPSPPLPSAICQCTFQ